MSEEKKVEQIQITPENSQFLTIKLLSEINQNLIRIAKALEQNHG